ncbi:MAG: hypothetical protein P4L50_29920 [Anaerolineaceae bacterium]|nr:hypothetical protein [Anaerolineaceae bacterium]
MLQTTLITATLEWERKLEIEVERRKNNNTDLEADYLAPLQTCSKPHKSILGRIFKPAGESQPVYRQSRQECCGEM